MPRAREIIARRSHSTAGGVIDQVLPLLLCVLGLAVMFHPMLRSGFRLMPGDLGDARFNNYVLEHTFRWLIGDPAHRSLWDMPVFYPAARTALYSDTFLGVAPIYWLLRAFVPYAETAFQLFMLAAAALNYTAFYALLRSGTGMSRTASAGGACLFAFAGMRTVQIGHQQLLSQFFPVLAALALLKVLARARAGRSAPGFLMAAGLCVVLQAYAGFYYFWFFMLCLAVLALWQLPQKETRAQLIAALRLNAAGAALAACVSGLLLLPLALGYRGVVAEIGYRDFGQVHRYLVPLRAWFSFEQTNFLYGWTAAIRPLRNILLIGEKHLGLGLLTPFCVVGGFCVLWRRPGGRALALAALTVFALITVIAEHYTLWSYVYRYVPGAAAVRAVSRMALLLLMPAAAAFAAFLERRRPAVAVCLCLGCLLEQLHSFQTFDKDVTRRTVQEIAAPLETERATCRAFVYSQAFAQYPDWKYQIDAMWVELATGLPTMNGYSGNTPLDWPLADVGVHAAPQEALLADSIRRWAESQRLPLTDVCWLRRFHRGPDAVLLSRLDGPLDQRLWKRSAPRRAARARAGRTR